MPLSLSFWNSNKAPTLYQGASKPSRFDNCTHHCIELKNVIELVEQIRKKVTDLKANEPNIKPAETVDYAKYTVMSHLLENLDAVITTFNNQNEQSVVKDELRDTAPLLIQLINIVSPLLTNDDTKKTLETKRNNHKELARKGTDIILVGGAAATSLAGPFLGGLLYCGVGLLASTGIKRYFKLNDDDPASYLMVKNLDAALSEAAFKIEIALRPLASESAPAQSSSTPRP